MEKFHDYKTTAVGVVVLVFILSLGVGLAVIYVTYQPHLIKAITPAAAAPQKNDNVEINEELLLMAEVLTHIDSDYYQDVEGAKTRLIYPAIEEMVSNLDPYSHFYPPAVVELQENFLKEYKGADAPKKFVDWRITDKDKEEIGYLKIESFDVEAVEEQVAEAAKKFREAKAKGVVIDLRGNAGGLLSVCMNVLEKFLPPNTFVMKTIGKDESKNEEYFTGKSYADYVKAPIVILTDDYTTSASEVVVGALRDHKRAIVLGKKTYGKGCVGRRFELSDGSMLVLTEAMYYLPSGESIHEKGIKPHIKMDTTDDAVMMKKAEEIIKNWKEYKDKYLK